MGRISKMTGWTREAWRIVSVVIGEFDRHNSFQAAAALTFITLLALVPLLVISLSVISQFNFSEKAFLDVVSTYFLPSAAIRDVIVSNLQAFARNAATLSIFGGIFFIFTSVSLLNTVEGVFDQIWFAQKRTIAQRLISFWTLITLAPVLFAAALFLSSEFLASPLITRVFRTALVQTLMGYVVPYVLTFVGILLVYRVFSPPQVKFRASIQGAAAATVLFQVSRWGFSVYLEKFANYWQIYGILGTLPAFFMWVYISWLIFLAGAELISVLQFDPRGGGREYKEEHSGYYALKVMLRIVRRFQEGSGPTSTSELEAAFPLHPGVLGGILTTLQEKGVIAAVETGDEGKCFLPARSPRTIPAIEIVSAFHGEPFALPPPDGEGEDGAVARLFRTVHRDIRSTLGTSLSDLVEEDPHLASR
ncbi:MAG TPA: YhjD/YihY/BrkB family envelope integrity protein [Thermodesulfobacteriota bacterium]|nr:YhjD/YihY/BrkB family envelope integrity protein [Thermodesulfobacteriota bacterium]